MPEWKYALNLLLSVFYSCVSVYWSARCSEYRLHLSQQWWWWWGGTLHAVSTDIIHSAGLISARLQWDGFGIAIRGRLLWVVWAVLAVRCGDSITARVQLLLSLAFKDAHIRSLQPIRRAPQAEAQIEEGNGPRWWTQLCSGVTNKDGGFVPLWDPM